MSVSLLEEEELAFELRPHLFSQIKNYILWITIFIAHGLYLVDSQALLAKLQGLFGIESVIWKTLLWVQGVVPEGPWLILVLTPAFLQALLRVQWKPFLGYLLIVGLTVGFCRYFELGLISNVQIWAGVCILALIGKEIQRFRTRYTVTNKRLVIDRFGFSRTTRTLFYSKIQDLVLSKPMIGGVFGYGTVVPLTASQLGTGSSSSHAGASVHMNSTVGASVHGGVSESQTTIQDMPEYTLSSIPKVDEVYNYILKHMGETS